MIYQASSSYAWFNTELLSNQTALKRPFSTGQSLLFFHFFWNSTFGESGTACYWLSPNKANQ